MKVADVPDPFSTQGVFVVDQGQVLGPDYSALITTISQQLQDKTGETLMVITVDALDGLTVDDYAEQLFKRLGIGEKGKDNGVLILLSRDDRRVRIEVGYGLESVLNDAKAGRLLDDHAVPFLHDDQFGRGLYEGAKAVALALADSAQRPLAISDPSSWPEQPSVTFGSSAIDSLDKRKLPFFMVIFSMSILIPLMILAKLICFTRRKTLEGRKAAITQLDAWPAAAYALPPLGAVMVGYSEHVLFFGILAAVIALIADFGMWFGAKWLSEQAGLWRPRCTSCQQAMAFVKTETSVPDGGSGKATDCWRCPSCGAEQQFSDTIYVSRGSGSRSYSRPSSGGGRSGGGSSGGGGASRGF